MAIYGKACVSRSFWTQNWPLKELPCSSSGFVRPSDSVGDERMVRCRFQEQLEVKVLSSTHALLRDCWFCSVLSEKQLGILSNITGPFGAGPKLILSWF